MLECVPVKIAVLRGFLRFLGNMLFPYSFQKKEKERLMKEELFIAVM